MLRRVDLQATNRVTLHSRDKMASFSVRRSVFSLAMTAALLASLPGSITAAPLTSDGRGECVKQDVIPTSNAVGYLAVIRA